ncbi:MULTISPECIES: TIGR03619 family F420-dependent LLM class oxidoreductase [unclassified Streptomyces]|uniref:TIGR03619 family F420-dependent LLM class oxidoreductase n=1 Tax=unclassified Streptomyces TaxID=2593676 RepID=UPI00137079C1|nr:MULTISPECIES: TIGR03619 family F420-dependent LLM class oxidoreductase [unclassified Streptomyces]NEA01218.1 TIGR03619 family F420-dependent LLM class oxidoreductase [Streptomyces sp. SID10116]MYY87626.1 TIGR03619 family F420-dependent LLM class oxidoreductase [Streptomyces sp. SID335]MYZ18055.1 TIGR03619 family F420-dependent LLM class oxidoreductase [Streptomyces sp. SID337]NDZ88645.1 TIGR03619 family F420-dependent LLM class oxidoreductase [Streptomyces sp. SID10115]NEB49805.1 TIGR03619 
MQLPVQSQSSLYAEEWERRAGPDDLVEIARTADRTGFAYIATCDHVAIPRRLADAMSTVWYDPVATLAHLAAVTENVRLMSHVAIVGLRHPLLSAKQYATLDHLSGGRLILGVGAGHVQEEFEALGVDFARRGPILDETIDALRAALGPEEYPEYAGETFAFRDLGQLPRPAQARVPLWVGGSSPAAIRRAAIRADGWLPQGDPRDKLPAQITKLKRLRQEAGIAEPVTVGAIAEPLYVGEPGWSVGRRTLAGKPEALAESLRAYAAMGVDQIQVRFRSRSRTELTDQMAAFAADVAPHLDGPH